MPACETCGETITQPLCGACLGREMAAWLQERVPERPELLLQLEDLTDDVLGDGDENCIKCRGPMRVCGRCYAESVFSWVTRSLPFHAPEFETLFLGGVPEPAMLRPVRLLARA